jgi:LPXTG-motif cell wall-anchored protein
MAARLGRRRFLLVGLGSGGTVLLGTAATSSADPSPARAWRLSANWGYAVAPKGRTRCKCTACHAHAANLVFSSRSAAVADRIHPCCVCQPFSVDVSAAGFDQLFASSARVDLRSPGARASFERAIDDVNGPTTISPQPPTITTPPQSTPTDAPTTRPITGPSPDATSEQIPAAAAVPQSTASSQMSPQPVLPTTGSDTTSTLLAAGLVTAAGVALVRTACSGD